MKKIAFIFLLFLLISPCHAQIEYENIGNNKVIKPSVNSLIYLLSMPLEKLDDSLKSLGYNSSLQNGCFYYHIGKPFSMQMITRCPVPSLFIDYDNVDPNKQYVVDILKELDSYFVEDLQGVKMYAFNYEGEKYRFTVVTADVMGSESVFVEKLK